MSLIEEHNANQDLDFIRLKLHVFEKSGDFSAIEKVVNNIDYKNFNEPTNSLLRLSDKIISLGYTSFGHDLAIKFFLDSPEKKLYVCIAYLSANNDVKQK
ncbi:hypothetical protein A4N31_23140 [Salmonella enterica subsp. enterica serovar Corvallis]|nr:hypothetical protein [Salmonella enterica subsp. enterica serovar Corvallis]